MATGTVKFFNSQKGFGFIQPQDGGKDVFVHISAVERAGMSTLNEGQKLSYDVVSERGKLAAANLQSRLTPSSRRTGSRPGGNTPGLLHGMQLSLLCSDEMHVRPRYTRDPETFRPAISTSGEREWQGNRRRAPNSICSTCSTTDGSQRSNRRVPREILGGLDGDAPARAVIEEQDRLIAEKSGQPALAVKSIRRSGAK